MKRLLSLLTALCLLLTTCPALAEEAPVVLRLPEQELIPPEYILLTDYIAWADELAASNGAAHEWSATPLDDQVTVTTCGPCGDQPALMSTADGHLVAFTAGVIMDAGDVHGCYNQFLSTMLVTLQPLMRTQGLDCSAATDAIIEACNTSEGYLAGIGSVLNTGKPMRFTFMGYEGEIALLQVGDQVLFVLYLCLEPAAGESSGAPEGDALAGQVVMAEAAALSLQDYLAAVNRLAADYRGTLSWSEFPLWDELTAHSCDTLGGNPTVVCDSEGMVVSIITGTYVDASQLQACFDDFMGSIITAMGALLYHQGADKQEMLQMLSPVMTNLAPDVIALLTQGGEAISFMYCGYDCAITLEETAEGRILSLTVNVQPEIPAGAAQ